MLNSRGMTLHALGSMPSFADILRQTMESVVTPREVEWLSDLFRPVVLDKYIPCWVDNL